MKIFLEVNLQLPIINLSIPFNLKIFYKKVKETAYVVKLIMILNSYSVSCIYNLPMKVTTLQLV